MDPISLGLALTILGMGGTLVTLFLISLLADLLKRLFPLVREEPPGKVASPSPPPAST